MSPSIFMMLLNLWRRLRGKVSGADAAAGVEIAQRTILHTLDRSDRAIARTMRQSDQAGATSATPPRHLKRFDVLCEELRQDVLRIRSTRPARGDGPAPGDMVAMEVRLREATGHIEALEADVERLEAGSAQELANGEEWRRRAMLAVNAGADDLAREALARAKEHEALSVELRHERDVGRRVTTELRSALVEVGLGRPPPR